jgi:hypothetical protein
MGEDPEPTLRDGATGGVRFRVVPDGGRRRERAGWMP